MGKLSIAAACSICVLPACAPDGADGLGASAAAVTAPVSIVFDPGPKNRCFHTSHEGVTGTQTDYLDSSGCAADDDPQRNDTSCTQFPHIGPDGKNICPAWELITYGWDSGRFTLYPGYDTQIWGSNGAPLTLVLQNNSRPLRTASGDQDCSLRETTFAYDYPSSAIRRTPTWGEYTLADGKLVVSYDAWAQYGGDFGCDEKRAIMTTDLILDDATRKYVISVVHYHPGDTTSQVGDVMWTNNCIDSLDHPDHTNDSCRVTVFGQPVGEATTTHLAIDFSALVDRVGSQYLKGLTSTSVARIHGIQFVNSTRGADLQTRVSGADVVLQPR